MIERCGRSPPSPEGIPNFAFIHFCDCILVQMVIPASPQDSNSSPRQREGMKKPWGGRSQEEEDVGKCDARKVAALAHLFI
jgi:hypothetical protein